MGAAVPIHIKRWQKGQLVLRLLLLGLCTLIVFAPRFNESARVQPTALALSAATQGYTLLAIPPRNSTDLQRLRSNQSDSFRRTLLSASPVASLYAYPYSPLTPAAVTFHLGLFDGMHRNTRQVCQLLDLPPPLYTL